jgi:hypothetical protein
LTSKLPSCIYIPYYKSVHCNFMSSESTETFRVAPARMADSENCMLVSEIGQDQRQKDSGRHRAGVWGTWWKVGVAGQVFRVGAPCHPFGRRTPNHTFSRNPR